MPPTISQALERCKGYCDLKMWKAAWNELEELPSEYKVELGVLSWRIQIQMGMGEHRKGSYIRLALLNQFPAKAEVLLSTVECPHHMPNYGKAAEPLTNGLKWMERIRTCG